MKRSGMRWRIVGGQAVLTLLGIAATPLLQPMPSFTRESGGTLHVAVMGVNRIGKNHASAHVGARLPPKVSFILILKARSWILEMG